ncbi:MAG: glycosyltransferase [Acidobacteriaceae bacterium]|nr:glycosyltransferase [Acidobacteriaceae bacterium]
MIVLASISLLIWIYLLFFRAGFWRVRKHLSYSCPPACARVVAVIPVRDEAENIAQTVTSLMNQTLPPFRIIVVDDSSTDGTGLVAAAAGARVIRGEPLPPGWTGKLWALQQGVEEAEALAPDFLLFTDGDIIHEPNNIAQLVAIAESGNYDLASYMVKLSCETLAEKALIPAFVFFFLMLYPPGRVPGAAGGCVVIRLSALQKIGGIGVIRREVIDDCALAQAVAGTGGRLWLGLTTQARSMRQYRTFAEVERMISRSAFNQLRHSALLLIATVAGLTLIYLVPIAALFTRSAAIGAITWLVMGIAYWPMVRFYGLSPLWSLSLPFIAMFYMGATIHSAIEYWAGRGGVWKGRAQDMVQR